MIINLTPSHVRNKVTSFLKREYGGNLSGDLVAGLTTAVVALPLALAFAIASGVKAKYGLYTAIVTGAVAAIFGGSKVQVSGPTGGMAAVLIAVTTVYGYEKVVLIAFLAGLMQLAASALRLGRFVRMLPFPLVAGFTAGIAIIIFGSQIDHALGLAVTHKDTEFYDRLLETIHGASVSGFQPACLMITGLVIGTMAVLSRKAPRVPAAMVAILAASIVSWALNLQIPFIRDIPSSLPSPSFPAFSWEMVRELLRPAATIAALGAIESLLAAVVADSMLADNSRHNSDRELFGQGMANLSASFVGGIPCTGAIARTAVNIRSGGRTRLAALVHSAVLLLIMIFFAPLATRIPIAALAGVLMVVAFRMVEWREMIWLLKAPRSDIAVMAVTVLLTVFTDLVIAVEFGLVTAGLLFIKRMTQIQPLDISTTSGSGAEKVGDQIRIFRMPGPLFWGDSHALIEALEECGPARAIILKMQLVTMIDASGVAAIREAKARLDRKGIRLILASIPDSALETLRRMGIAQEIGEKNIYTSIEGAKAAAERAVAGLST